VSLQRVCVSNDEAVDSVPWRTIRMCTCVWQMPRVSPTIRLTKSEVGGLQSTVWIYIILPTGSRCDHRSGHTLDIGFLIKDSATMQGSLVSCTHGQKERQRTSQDRQQHERAKVGKFLSL